MLTVPCGGVTLILACAPYLRVFGPGGEIFTRPDSDDLVAAVVEECRDLYLLDFPTTGQNTRKVVRGVVYEIVLALPLVALFAVGLVRPLERLSAAARRYPAAPLADPTKLYYYGLSQGHISKVLNGENPEAAFYVIAKIAKAIDVSLDWITEEPRAAKAKSEPPAATGTDPRR